jgi:hypothetical protein
LVMGFGGVDAHGPEEQTFLAAFFQKVALA